MTGINPIKALDIKSTKLAKFLGVMGTSLLIGLPVGAETPTKGVVAQRTTPSPSILQECPYNRAACPGGGTVSPETPSPETPSFGTTDNKSIAAVVESNGSFTILNQALKAAGLVDQLQEKGPFTFFAPNDTAFRKLPQDAVEDLLKPENKEVLVKILKYHIVTDSVRSTTLKTGEIKSMEGGAINVKVDPQSGVSVNDARVIQADIQASNGIIHVIDNVILPPDV
ncbi:fasciclin domain-containing protein [Floridanema evergladense]|uniref:Fasciclin domain-containing protein n=1 Tax=Floridaenema evergladense BLCC-F167 TaxID=3153639 RepID=A0ABV4WLH3_9CYAN